MFKLVFKGLSSAVAQPAVTHSRYERGCRVTNLGAKTQITLLSAQAHELACLD